MQCREHTPWHVAVHAATAGAWYPCVQHFADGSGRVSPSGNLLSGVLAGAVEAVLWTAPTERLKVLQQKNVRAR